jgi:hypothetical protein
MEEGDIYPELPKFANAEDDGDGELTSLSVSLLLRLMTTDRKTS